ncbi:MAG: DUF4124 domain-containing protein [Pseudomonadales bacterium]|nr:DUF4124 domain-containing protein [Pseudomonadales bacterium]
MIRGQYSTMLRSIPTIFVLTTLAAFGVFAAERPYYMWVDENGILNYSQDKPKDTDAEEIYGRPTPRLGNPVSEESPQPASKVPPGGTVIDEEEIEAVNEKARQLNCEIGHRMKARLSEHKNTYMQDEDGWWRKLSPEQHEAQVKKAEELIATYCPPS